MSIRSCNSLFLILAIFLSPPAWAESSDIVELRAALNELRQDYDQRIAALEKRLAVAENRAVAAQATAPAPPPPKRSATADSTFNPAIGVIFQGQLWRHSNSTHDEQLQGFPFGGEAGPFEPGLAIGESEINISANVDDKFTAWLTAPLVIEDGEPGVEIEEAWLETTALPGGFSTRFGRFFSGIGYLNQKHAHSWDFADQPLPYQAFLGDQYLDDGIQLRWIAPTDLFMEFGVEEFRGSRFPAAGSSRSGNGSNSIFAKFGGDAGPNQSWLGGLSRLTARSVDRPVGDEDSPLFFSGMTDTTIAQLVWKWSPNGNWRQRNLVIQSEYFWNSDRGNYTLPDTTTLNYDNDQRGWYIQSVYQPLPGWRFGARVDSLSKDATVPLFANSVLAAPLDDPIRYSLMADWSNSEFSRLRLQYARDKTDLTNSSQWGLQYILSIGAHGGHSF